MNPRRLSLWQAAFLLTSVSWLLAPVLNHVLSPRSSLISQYETSGQPYALLFRACDLAAGLLVAGIALGAFRKTAPRSVWILLLVAGTGMALDPILTTTCVVRGNVCAEQIGLPFLLHAAETVVTAAAFVWLGVLDALRRKRLASIAISLFQAGYGLLFLTQLSADANVNTVTQFIYQGLLFVWLAWFCRDYLLGPPAPQPFRRISTVRRLAALWTFLNGVFAIVISLADINLLGRLRGLYFAPGTAWLAQHGVVIGVAMLYLTRHIHRGELRARQLLLALLGLEILRYSLLTPHALLLGLYAFTFCVLFVAASDFQRGSAPLTWRLRAKDLTFLVLGLGAAAAVAYVVLDRDSRVATITAHTVGHYADYALHNRHLPGAHLHKTHRESVLLAHTLTAFLVASLAAALWAVFRPRRAFAPPPTPPEQVRAALEHYATSSEDFLKLWPVEKQYFWSHGGFIAYTVAGPVAFALADPIGPANSRAALLADFTAWTQTYGLRCCFLAVPQPALTTYRMLNSLQIGASALVDTHTFTTVTVKDKWWRWKQNSARKAGYSYTAGTPPHSSALLRELRHVSDQWLQHGNHHERGFALGYFDDAYLQQCVMHCLRDRTGRLVAFVNQPPTFGSVTTQTIDLLRYLPDTQNAMPFLLAQVIETVQCSGTPTFDLGFVPFAATRGSLQTITKTLSAGHFSAKGLEQFKNKFDPVWQPVYLVYDGDMGDLALIGLNLERAMKRGSAPAS